MSELSSALSGTWIPIAAEVSGHQLVVARLRVAQFIIERDRYRIVDHDDAVVDRGELFLNQACVPYALDIVGVDGPYAGKCMRAIIELDGDRLCVCYNLDDSERPQSMRPQGDQLLLTITYVRTPRPRPRLC